MTRAERQRRKRFDYEEIIEFREVPSGSALQNRARRLDLTLDQGLRRKNSPPPAIEIANFRVLREIGDI